MTLGEYRVGIWSAPRDSTLVGGIKRRAADLIDIVESIGSDDPEVRRLKALAQTHFEEATMWAVKAATKMKRD